MVRFELLSPNALVLIDEILKNQELCKYLYYETKNPLGEPDLTLPANNLLFKNVFPYPFVNLTDTAAHNEIRVYFTKGRVRSGKLEYPRIVFDVVVHKDLWLVNDGTNSLIRPYEIMKYLSKSFDDKSIGTLGNVHFDEFTYVAWNESYSGYRLFADVYTISGK